MPFVSPPFTGVFFAGSEILRDLLFAPPLAFSALLRSAFSNCLATSILNLKRPSLARIKEENMIHDERINCFSIVEDRKAKKKGTL